MKCYYNHFPPQGFNPYDIRDIQNRESIYRSWKEYYEDGEKRNPSEYVIYYWFFHQKKVEKGEICISLKNEELSLDMMEAIENIENFCLWLPPHENQD
jgi:hypothetical protein